MLRKGEKKDLPQTLKLIMELADYEKGLHFVTNTVEQMEKDGFGDTPLYQFWVVEKDKRIVGTALYYYRYSTWRGKQLYLEDIIVTETERGNGYGKQLFDKLYEISVKEGCNGMMWQVLDWNKPAIEFYKRHGARFGPEWINCYLGEKP